MSNTRGAIVYPMSSHERPSITVLALTFGLAALLWAFTNTVKSLLKANIDALSLVQQQVTPTAPVEQPAMPRIDHPWWQDTEQQDKLGDPTDAWIPEPRETGPHATMIPAGTSPLQMMRGMHGPNLAGETWGQPTDGEYADA